MSFFAVLALAAILGGGVRAQVGAPGIEDLNAMSESSLAALPGLNAAIAKAFVAARPFPTIVEANTFLLGHKLTPEQLTPIYEKAFVHLNLNTATDAEILLVPRIARRMSREFEEYRPWVNLAQFDREIGKYVDDTEVNRLKKYVFIPVKLNTATPADFMTIPGVGERMVREFEEYRPWRTKEQFDREIGKYVDQKEVARLWRFVTIE
jgi:DNA uptake protein ComE-like DNA-binding protein